MLVSEPFKGLAVAGSFVFLQDVLGLDESVLGIVHLEGLVDHVDFVFSQIGSHVLVLVHLDLLVSSQTTYRSNCLFPLYF